MIYFLGSLLLGFGMLAFIIVPITNYFVLKKHSNNKNQYLPTYVLLALLIVSLVLILIDLLTEDISVSSGFKGLRGFLAYSSFVVYLLNVIVSYFTLWLYKRIRHQ